MIATHLDDLHWRLSVQYDSSTDQAEHRPEHGADSTGAIAVSGDGGSVAVLPPSARQCSVLELSHGSAIRWQTVLEPEKPASPQSSLAWVRHCALSRSGTLTALYIGDGHVSVYDRSGTRRCRASNKDWLRGRVLGIFFESDEVLMVACQDGLLYMVDARSGAVSPPSFVKGQMPSPLSCGFDPSHKILALASRASSRADKVCLALWQITAGAPPHLLGCCGRPARQGLFGRREQPAPAWTLSLDAQAGVCLVAAGGDQLHVFRWKEAEARALSVSYAAIALAGPHSGAALWGSGCAAVLQPTGMLAAVRLDERGQPCDIAQFSSNCIFRALPAEATGACPRLALVDPKAGKGAAATWHLNILELLRPEDELEDLLAAGDYGAASALAKKHGLARDTVLKHQWRASCSSGRPDLEILEAVEDRAWVAWQSMQAVTPTSTSQAKLTGLGLAETDSCARAEASSPSHGQTEDANSGSIHSATRQGGPPDSGHDSNPGSIVGSPSMEEAPGHPTGSGAVSTLSMHKAPGHRAGSTGCQSAASCRWRAQRLHLLRHRARLQTHLDLNSGVFDSAAFRAFRDCSLVQAAAALAARADLESVETLMQHHAYTLTPHLLDILASVPETVPPSQYLHLLPKAEETGSQPEPALLTPEDWVESKETIAALRAAGEHGPLLATERMACLAIGWQPPSMRQVDEWREARAGSVKICSGQLGHAMDHLKGSSRSRSPHMQSLRKAARTLSELIRPGMEHELGWDMSLSEWAALGMPGRLQMLADAQLPLRQQRGLLARLLAHEDPHERRSLLSGLMAQNAPARLQWCMDLLSQESHDCQVFADLFSVAEAACRAAEACGPGSDWGLVQGLAEQICSSLEAASASGLNKAAADAAPSDDWGGWDDAFEANPSSGHQHAADTDAASLRRQLKQVEGLALAAGELTALGIIASLRELRTESGAQATTLVREWLGRLENAKPALSEHRWTEAWRRLKLIREAAALDMTDADVLRMLCGALLRCQQWRLAAKYLRGTASTPLAPSTAEALVLGCARELLASAAGPASPEISQALTCLQLLPNSTAAASEATFIEAIERLQEYSIGLSPIQCLQVEDRMDLIQLVLDTQPTAYRDAGRLAMMAEQLGISERHADVMLRQARAACKAGDIALAHELALQLARQGHLPAWELAAEVLASKSYPELVAYSEEQECLSMFIVAHCPAAQLGHHLLRWQQQACRSQAPLLPEALIGMLRSSLVTDVAIAAHACVPGLGDASKALACLLELEPLGPDIEQQLDQGAPFAASRALLLLRMTANALLALAGADGGTSDREEQARRAQERLHATAPWDLLHAAAALDPEILTPAAREAQQSCQRLSLQLGSASEERLLQAFLPASAVPTFTAADNTSEAAKQQQEDALMQAVLKAVEGRDMAHALAHLQQATSVAARYQLSAWHLRMHFIEAILTLPIPLGGAEDAVKDIAAVVLEDTDGALHALVSSVWPDVTNDSPEKLQMLIVMLRRICTEKGCSEDALQALHTAGQFAQQATSIARGLDVRLFIGPAIALAVQHVSLELSQQILPPLMGLAAPVLEQRQEVQGKQPLKRALFPEPQAYAGVNGSPHQADLAAIWHERAHIEISRHISSSNAMQLAALMRALPLPQASQALAGPSNGSAVQPAVPLSHSSVLLAHLQKALPAPQQLPGAQQQASAAASSAAGARSELQTHSSSAEAGHSSSGSGQAGATQHSLGMAVAAGESPEASALEEAYRGCRKHLKQLQAGHLAALLRFWLQRGPSPIPSVASSRPELRGALRLRALQDGIAASRRHAGKARQPAEATVAGEVQNLEGLVQQLQQEEQSQALLMRIKGSATLTAEQTAIILDFVAPGSGLSRCDEDTTPVATLQRLAASSCNIRTIALVAHELRGARQGSSAQTEAGRTTMIDQNTSSGIDQHGAAMHALSAAKDAAAAQVTSAVQALTADDNPAQEELRTSASDAQGSNAALLSPRDASCALTAVAHGGNAVAEPLQAVLAYLEDSNEAEPPKMPWHSEHFAATLKSVRDMAWLEMEGAVLAAAAGMHGELVTLPSSLLAVLEAMASIAPVHGSRASKRWVGWEPESPISAQLRCLLLSSITHSTVAHAFPSKCAQPALIASLPAADTIFMALLGRAEAMQHFMALHALLEEVWDSGHAFEDGQPVAASQPVPEPTPDGTAHQEQDIADSKYGEMKAARKLVNPELPSAGTEGLQAEERSSSAPGTPPAEESRWPSSASMQGTVDGWQERLPLPTRSLGSFASLSARNAAQGWEEPGELPMPKGSLHSASPHADTGTAEGWDELEELPLPRSSLGKASSQAVGYATEGPDEREKLFMPRGSLAITDGWEGEAAPELPPEVLQDKSAAARHRAHANGDGSQLANLSNRHTEMADPVDDVEGWGSDDELDFSAPTQRVEGRRPSSADGEPPAVDSNESLATKGASDAGRGGKSHAQASAITREEPVPPLHACWAALMQRMLGGADRELAGRVLRWLDKAERQGVTLVSKGEADAIASAAEQAGADIAIAVRLLLPGAMHRAAAEERLQGLTELPKPADASLAVLLLAKGLWPEATSSPAYPQLARSLLDHASLSNEEPSMLAALVPTAAASAAGSGRQAQAAALAAAHLSLHPAFSSISNTMSGLRPYLTGSAQLGRRGAGVERAAERGADSRSGDEVEDLSVPEAAHRVWGMLQGQCQTALNRMCMNE